MRIDRTGRAAGRGRRTAPDGGAAARGGHHGRQRSVGDAARAAARRRAPGGSEGREPRRGGGPAPGDRDAHALRLLGRQLAASRGRGRGAHAPLRALPRPRGAPVRGERDPPHGSSAGATGSSLALVRAIEAAEAFTAAGEAMELRIAVDYSGRDAILAAIELLPPAATPTREALLAALARAGRGGAPEVDLLVRTGGEHRISDFLLWESAYAEVFFSDRLLARRGSRRPRRGARLVLRAGAAVRRPARRPRPIAAGDAGRSAGADARAAAA